VSERSGFVCGVGIVLSARVRVGTTLGDNGHVYVGAKWMPPPTNLASEGQER